MEIKLYKMPFLDRNYTNVIDFKSITDRTSYFNSQTSMTINSNVKYDSLREQITIPKNIQEISSYDYLSYKDQNNKDLYYFIYSKEYQTADNTILYLQLDIFTTFQFDVTFLNSYIDRCHVPRWNGSTPTNETVDEGFNFSNYVLYAKDEIGNLKNNYLMTSTDPLGVLDTSTGGDTGSGGGSMQNGVMSANGFVFIKGYEAFSDYGLYLNGEDFKTVGYGFTEKHNLEYYNQHKPFPCTEQLASELFAEHIINGYGKRIYTEIQNNSLQSKITTSMFDAMCSLAWNRGVNGFLNDPTSPWQLIKTNPLDSAISDVWKSYAITSNGQPLEGLRLRRIAEVNIYFGSSYEFRSIIKYTDDGTNTGTAIRDGVVTDNDGKGFIPPIFLSALNGTGSFVIGSTGELMIPCLGTVTATWHSYYNEVINYWHDGIDIANNEGTPIYASRSGKVLRVVDLGSEAWGLYVDIDHEDGTFTRYAHCSTVDVKQYDVIKEGQQIAKVGNTGTSTGAHLHWGVYSSNVAVDFDINDKLPRYKEITQNMGVL